MVRVVFDTVILVRSLLNPNSVWGRLVFARQGDYWLVASEPVLTEFLEVLSRPAIERKFRFVAGQDKRALLDRLEVAEIVEIDSIPTVSRDVKDDKFLATAKAAGAGYLVTEDEDLLVLGQYEGTRSVTAAAFLAILDEPQNPQSPTTG